MKVVACLLGALLAAAAEAGTPLQEAQALVELAQTSSNKTERLAYARDAFAHFTTAGSRDTDGRAFYAWGEFLQYCGENLAETEQQRTDWLSEAALKFQAGLKLTKNADERRSLNRELAACLVGVAGRIRAEKDKTALLQTALRICEELARDSAAADQSRLNGIWGSALVLSCSMNRDRMRLRLATEKLDSALDEQPRNAELRYRLAAAYALLDSQPEALRHLRLCLENDPTGAFARMAAGDVSLNSLRGLPEFETLIAPRKPAAGWLTP